LFSIEIETLQRLWYISAIIVSMIAILKFTLDIFYHKKIHKKRK